MKTTKALLQQSKLSSAEYQKVKSSNGFNSAAYIWSNNEQLYIKA